MADVDPIYRNLIQFVPEQQSSDKNILPQSTSKDNDVPAVSGTDIKNFYLSVIGSDNKESTAECEPESLPQHSRRSHRAKVKHSTYNVPTRSTSNETKREPVEVSLAGANSSCTVDPAASSSSNLTGPTLTRQKRRHFKFLHSAQVGNVNEMTRLLDQGVSINYQDSYGWTALMCAAHAGQEKAVAYLLQQDADGTLTNNQGQTADILASVAGHTAVAESLLTANSLSHNIKPEPREQDPPFYCLICQENFPEGEKSHQSSTVHLFNSGRRPRQPSYMLPESNRGYQMLLRTGWSAEQGLGPSGHGPMYPVRTVLKRDREGLGHGKKKAKITHFNPHDKAAVERATNTQNERQMSARKCAQLALKSKDRKQRRLEHDFRLELGGI